MVRVGLMGVFLGLLAVAYIRGFHAIGGFFRRLTFPQPLKLTAGLAIVGLIAIPLPQNLSDGYPVINAAFAGQFGITMMASLMLAKFFASAISLDCGAPGGVFGPTFFIGTMAGGVCREPSYLILHALTGARGSYSLVWFGAFLFRSARS